MTINSGPELNSKNFFSFLDKAQVGPDGVVTGLPPTITTEQGRNLQLFIEDSFNIARLDTSREVVLVGSGETAKPGEVGAEVKAIHLGDQVVQNYLSAQLDGQKKAHFTEKLILAPVARICTPSFPNTDSRNGILPYPVALLPRPDRQDIRQRELLELELWSRNQAESQYIACIGLLRQTQLDRRFDNSILMARPEALNLWRPQIKLQGVYLTP